MDKIDRLMRKVKPKPTICERLEKDNPYLGKTDAEILDYLSGDNYHAPDMRTREWDKFMYALIHATHEDTMKEEVL